jgi:signal transduction histidine kinase
MFERYLCKSIHYDESVIRLIRPSWLHYRFAILGYSILILLAMFFLYPLQTFGKMGWVIFCVLLFAGLLGLFRIWFIRTLTAFIVTNQRIVDIEQRRFFERHVSECTLDNIRDIRYNTSGLLHMLANVGTVVIETGGDNGHLECQDVHAPESVKELLVRVGRNHKSS